MLPMLINKATSHNNANNSDNEVCILEDMTIGAPEVISNDTYSINEITLTIRPDYIKTNAQPVVSC